MCRHWDSQGTETLHPPNGASSRSVILVVQAVLAGALCALLIVAIAPAASSDIVTCPEVKPPRNDAAALRRAGFAFDGVVVGGRQVRDPRTGAEILVSPLTFRVTRTLLGNPTVFSDDDTAASGGYVVTAWDALYAESSLWRRIERDEASDTTVRGEIRASLGARWRIYGLQEVVNWTSKTCLGSHPIQGASAQRSSDQESRGPLWVVVFGGLAAAAIVSVAGWRFRRSRQMSRREPDRQSPDLHSPKSPGNLPRQGFTLRRPSRAFGWVMDAIRNRTARS
jgi:hypothetical protein